MLLSNLAKYGLSAIWQTPARIAARYAVGCQVPKIVAAFDSIQKAF
jgi:hypothetical protein